MKRKTTDSLTIDRLNFYTTGKLGRTRELTPEGFLLCREVAIARTGTQLYGPDEVPIDPGPDGIVRIDRPEEEVFREETIASFEGKPVTCEHPNDFVTPETWKQLTVGICQNVRRGLGIDSDLLMADLLITDSGAIQYVNKELPELSAGYEADYQQTEPGRGVQRNIVGNHVALVERGRAGPRCSINDKEPDMAKVSVWDRIRTAFKSKDEAALEEAIKAADSEESEEEKAKREAEEAKEKATNDAIAALKKTVDELAEKVEKMTEDEDDPEKKKSDDEEEEEKAKVGDSMKEVAVLAEILCPGLSIPTTDSIKDGKAVAGVQRRVLAEAMKTEDGKKAVTPLLAGKTLDGIADTEIGTVFRASAEIMRQQNNTRGVRSGVTTQDFGRSNTNASINQVNRDFWSGRQSK